MVIFLFLILGLLVWPICMNARQLSEEEAKDIAEQFLSEKVKRTETDNLRRKMANNKTGTSESAFYIFNAEDGDGFVIVNAVAEAPNSILGYSDAGFLDPNSMAPQLELLMDQWVRCAESYSMMSAKAPAKLYEPKLLTTANWNQGEPYNNDCPLSDFYENEKSPTGCVATAMAIVMKYYNWPQKARGEHVNAFSKVYTDYSNFNINWDILGNTTEELSSSENASKEIAALLRGVGESVNTMYGISPTAGSAAYSEYVCPPLFSIFKYKMPVFYYRVDPYGYFYITDEEWIGRISSEIYAGRPVIYSMLLEESNSDSGHTFVVDGIDENGLLHVNYGWGGNSNGYYSLWSPGADVHMTASHNIIVGIEPDYSTMDDLPLAFIGPHETEACGWNVNYEIPIEYNGEYYYPGYGTILYNPFDKQFEYTIAFVDVNNNILGLATDEINKYVVDYEGVYGGCQPFFRVKAKAPAGSIGTAVIYRMNENLPWKIVPASGGSSNLSLLDGRNTKYRELTWDIPSDARYEIFDNVAYDMSYQARNTETQQQILPSKVIANQTSWIDYAVDYGSVDVYFNNIKIPTNISNGICSFIFPDRCLEQRADSLNIKVNVIPGSQRKIQYGKYKYVIDDKDMSAKLTWDNPPYHFTEVSDLPSVIKHEGKDYLVTKIGDRAFYASFNKDCLSTVIIPSSVETVCSQAFYGVEIQKLLFGKGSKLKVIEANAFRDAIRDDEIFFPDGLEVIEDYAFEYHAIHKITIPKTVSRIGRESFKSFGSTGYKGKIEVTVAWTNPEEVNVDPTAFNQHYNNPDYEPYQILYVPKGTSELYRQIEAWQQFDEIIEYQQTGIGDVIHKDDFESSLIYTSEGLFVGRGNPYEMQLRTGIYIVKMPTEVLRIYIQ